MSCFHPITVKNPAKVKNRVYDKSTLEVPCGHCIGCKNDKRLGFFIRLYYEMKYCIDNDGFALYETLTYNNEHLPVILKASGLNDGKGIPCFSISRVQKYLKRIRKKLKDLGYNIQFKYFLSMEYGCRLHRPHYHILFFVPTPLISRFRFKKIVEELWIENGFVKAGSSNFGFVNGTGALQYCAKYVCKDIYEDTYLNKLEKKLLSCGFKKDDFKDIYPKTLLSQGLGIYALEYDKNNDFKTFLNGDIRIEMKKDIIKAFKLPLYYERKLFFDVHYRYFDDSSNSYFSVSKLADVPYGVDYSPIYVLNDLGLEMRDKRIEKRVDAVTNVYRIVTCVPEDTSILYKLNNKFKTNYKTLVQFQDFVKVHLPESIFVNYSLIYRGCHVSQNCIPSPLGSTPYMDYTLINRMNFGVRPLSVDFNNLCYNIDYYCNLPYIEDLYQMIRYVYFLLHLNLEDKFLKEELDYCNQKSAYLLTQT